MAWTQADVDNLKKLIATGASRIKVNERDTTMRTLAEAKEILSMMESEVSPTTDSTTKAYRFRTSKGF
jgi:hypothetical protein